jgi:hypothetical protein
MLSCIRLLQLGKQRHELAYRPLCDVFPTSPYRYHDELRLYCSVMRCDCSALNLDLLKTALWLLDYVAD